MIMSNDRQKEQTKERYKNRKFTFDQIKLNRIKCRARFSEKKLLMESNLKDTESDPESLFRDDIHGTC